MEFLHLLIQAISLVVIVDAISSWVVRSPNAFPRSITGAITQPLYAPFRAILRPERLGGIDVSPLLVLLTLNLLARGLVQLASGA